MIAAAAVVVVECFFFLAAFFSSCFDGEIAFGLLCKLIAQVCSIIVSLSINFLLKIAGESENVSTY